jgi:glycosyltransferase involved in cell wall biosynthesis
VKGRLVLFTPGHLEPGGAQQRSRLLAAGLAASGWQVRAVTRAGSMNRPRIRRSEGITVVEVPGFGRRRLGGALFMVVALPLGLLWGARASAFLSLQLMSTSSIAATCGLVLRRPFLALATTTGKLSEIAYLRSTRTWPIRRRLLGRAAWLLAQTEDARTALSALVPKERVAVLPNPVEVPDEPPPLNGRPRVTFAGRLSAEKNLFRLLDAWQQVAAEIPDAELTLLGEGGDFRSVEAELRDRVASEPVLRKTVALPGWAEDPDAALARSDVFVLPSTEEGMSNALLEACALGRIVVASGIPPNRAVLGDDYPFLFPPTSTEHLANTLSAALDSDNDDRRRARELVWERIAPFSTAAVVGLLEDLIDATSRSHS